ncbi:hypothetical protein Gotur_034321 [Gossypium turneri]
MTKKANGKGGRGSNWVGDKWIESGSGKVERCHLSSNCERVDKGEDGGGVAGGGFD